MANKKKSAPSPIHQLIAYASPAEDKSILSLPISKTENIDIEIKKIINADEMEAFVSGVANAIFVADTYMPSLCSLVLAKAILAYYTNIGVGISDEDIPFLVFGTGIIDKIRSKIDENQLNSLIVSIDKSIEFKKQEIFNTQSSRLKAAVDQVELLIDVVSNTAAQFEGINMKEVADAAIRISKLSDEDRIKNILEERLEESTGIEPSKNPDITIN